MSSHDHSHDHAPAGGASGHDHAHAHPAAPPPVAHDHGHDHGHGHGHGHDRVAPSRLGVVLGLQFSYLLVELVGGWWTGSLALIADAGHMATDVTALGMVLVAARIAQRPANATQTPGSSKPWACPHHHAGGKPPRPQFFSA